MLRPRAATILSAVLFAAAPAASEPPDGADPALHGWFQSLKQPGTDYSCCSIADCRPTEYRLVADGYEAWLDRHWVRVPNDRILRGRANPVGRAVICRSPANGSILCFVPASET